MADTSHVKPPKSQYHHFIPRLIVRNFVHPHNQLKGSSKQPGKNDKRLKNSDRKYNEPMIYAVDLSKPAAEIVELPVSRIPGMADTYRDLRDSINQRYLEDELSKLESRVILIIIKMRRCFEEGKADIWITRTERNELRKFFFIVKYRSSQMHKLFFHRNGEGYNTDDRQKLLRYMEEKGFKKPLDVWFDNIKGMLESKMDVKDDWMSDLPSRIYPDDAKWFIAHTQMTYLTLCTPTKEDDEFLLTENAYGVCEGPSRVLKNPNTGEVIMPYTDFHMFAVISPKLIMVLRSFLLPVPEEDPNEEIIRIYRDTIFKLNALQQSCPSAAASYLADLPVAKPRNSYSNIVDGRMEMHVGRDFGSRHVNDRFSFRFFPLVTKYVHKINAIMLEESSNNSNIVFKTHVGLQRAIDYYLRMPTDHGFKICDTTTDDPKLCHLKKLERLVNEIGSNVTVVYGTKILEQVNLEEQEQIWSQVFEQNGPKKPTETMQIYSKLGGSPQTLLKDVEQARRMLNMRIKIDVFTQGLNEDFREGVREDLRELFCQLPPRRVWYYLKCVRNMLLRGHRTSPNEDIATELEATLVIDGPEDSIAMGISHIFRNTTELCRLLWYSTLKSISMIKHPDINFDTIITMDREGIRRINLQRLLFFGSPGSICDCGIRIVEKNAMGYKYMARSSPTLEESMNPYWEIEENIEMITRCMVRESFADMVGSMVSVEKLQGLKHTLFEVVYPTAS